MRTLVASEHSEQVALMQWAKLEERNYPQLALLYAIPNGGKRNIVVAHKLKAEGVKSGVPDLFLPVARDRYHGLYIEMKRFGGKPSAEQLWWKEQLTGQGYLVLICEGWEVAQHALVQYLEMPSTRRGA